MSQRALSSPASAGAAGLWWVALTCTLLGVASCAPPEQFHSDDMPGEDAGLGEGGGPGTGGSRVMPGTGGQVAATGGAAAGGSGNAGTGGAAAGRGGTGGTAGMGAAGAGTGGRGTGGVGTGGSSTGGRGTGGAGTGGSGTGGAGDTARFNFEADVQGWASAPDAGLTLFANVATSTTQHFAGLSSLAGTITLPANGRGALVVHPTNTPGPPTAGMTVTYRIFVPAGPIDWVQPYVQEVAPSYLFTSSPGGIQSVRAGAWMTVGVTVPSNSVAIGTIGVQFHSMTGGTATVYLDGLNY